MKSKNLNFKTWALLLFFSFGLLQVSAQSKSSNTNNVEITIDKSTSDKDFENIKDMLAEQGIDASFKNIKRNKSEEITGLSIKLSDKNGQQTNSSFSSNMPIKSMTFGSKDGNLFIGKSKDGPNMFALFNNNNFARSFDMDSIFGSRFNNFNMDNFFNGNSNMFMFEGDSLDLNAFKQKFMKNFNFGGNDNNNLSDYLNKSNKKQRFNFVDNPDKDTLIVIDGEISNFETLDKLAKSDAITSVDVLQPETAMSIYGNKAKDGAIIAISR